MIVAALLPLLLTPRAVAQDEAGDLSYEGNLSQTANGYVVGKPVTIVHSGGNLEVRCMDVEKLSARASYALTGSAEGPMEAYGRGVGLSATGNATGGTIRTRVPAKGAGIATAKVEVKVNVPAGASSVTITQTGSGWTQVIGCGGALKVTSGKDGLYAGGAYASVMATASGGDAKVVLDKDVLLTGATTVSAPVGSAELVVAGAQGGKLTARADEVVVGPLVLGTVTPTLVSGDMGLKGPAITVTAKTKATVRTE
jgi:hypothetical protein